MALYTLESLVLRGFSVLSGGESVNLRLGANATGYATTAIDTSMRRPTQDPVQVTEPAPWQEPKVGDDLGFDAGVVGAGRLRCVGNRRCRHLGRNPSRSVLHRFGPAKATLGSAAVRRSVRRTGSSCAWLRTPPAAAC
jgi:hypothetical protein